MIAVFLSCWWWGFFLFFLVCFIVVVVALVHFLVVLFFFFFWFSMMLFEIHFICFLLFFFKGFKPESFISKQLIVSFCHCLLQFIKIYTMFKWLKKEKKKKFTKTHSKSLNIVHIFTNQANNERNDQQLETNSSGCHPLLSQASSNQQVNFYNSTSTTVLRVHWLRK